MRMRENRLGLECNVVFVLCLSPHLAALPPCPLPARPHRIQSSFCWRRKNDEISTEGAESVLLIGGVVSVVTHKCSRYCCYDHNENRTAEVELFWDYYLVCKSLFNAGACNVIES